MINIARFLPLITVVAWLITLALPVLDSGNGHGPRIVVTSLGGDPFDLAGIELPFVLAWIGILGCAVTVWLLRSLTWWSVVAVLVTIALVALGAQLITDPPTLIWGGVDDQGRPTGGMERGEPVAGALVWLLGIAALATAAVCGFLGSRRVRRVQRLSNAG
ncbi:hypothetical protein [Microlunatus soli]|uniref:Tryptophan-associated transmembrane protein (Trp_oprn_chp) n=1 Tax=Microlunatus soli TaxID=630515 RepID=A0A1H1YHE9_9ACTN|nr:hypothetical protein [Microlunatus soli]SDT20853.1 hypothetical protein SAMN04489812_4583 [Microlunatus soli]